jgi:hypothetical protein
MKVCSCIKTLTADTLLTASVASGQGSCLQSQRSGCDPRRYQIFWELMGLERGPLSPVSKIEELLERKSTGSGTENTAVGICRADHPTLSIKSWH